MIRPIPFTAKFAVVSGSPATLGDMRTGRYMFTCSADVLLAQGEQPSAALADGSMLVPAGSTIFLSGVDGPRISVVAARAGEGCCTLVAVTAA